MAGRASKSERDSILSVNRRVSLIKVRLHFKDLKSTRFFFIFLPDILLCFSFPSGWQIGAIFSLTTLVASSVRRFTYLRLVCTTATNVTGNTSQQEFPTSVLTRRRCSTKTQDALFLNSISMIALFVPRASSRTGSGVGGLGAGLGVLGSGPGLKSGLGLQINSEGREFYSALNHSTINGSGKRPKLGLIRLVSDPQPRLLFSTSLLSVVSKA